MAEFQKLDTIDVQQLQADFEKYERAGCNVLPLNVTIISHMIPPNAVLTISDIPDRAFLERIDRIFRNVFE